MRFGGFATLVNPAGFHSDPARGARTSYLQPLTPLSCGECFFIQTFMLKQAWQQVQMKNPKTRCVLGFCFSREPGRIRTCDRLLRRQMLYPAELRVQTIYRGW